LGFGLKKNHIGGFPKGFVKRKLEPDLPLSQVPWLRKLRS